MLASSRADEREQAIHGLAGGVPNQVGLHGLSQRHVVVSGGQLGMVARGPHFVQVLLHDGRKSGGELGAGGALQKLGSGIFLASQNISDIEESQVFDGGNEDRLAATGSSCGPRFSDSSNLSTRLSNSILRNVLATCQASGGKGANEVEAIHLRRLVGSFANALQQGFFEAAGGFGATAAIVGARVASWQLQAAGQLDAFKIGEAKLG